MAWLSWARYCGELHGQENDDRRFDWRVVDELLSNFQMAKSSICDGVQKGYQVGSRRWIAPDKNYFRVDVDVKYDGEKESYGIGVVVIDFEGRIVTALAKPIPRPMSVQEGETIAALIEPESQTKLLDTTMNMEGVLLAGVPGAGGFDAVFAVTLGDSSSSVVKIWSSLNVLALLVREDPRGVSLERNDPQAAEVTDAVSSIRIE